MLPVKHYSIKLFTTMFQSHLLYMMHCYDYCQSYKNAESLFHICYHFLEAYWVMLYSKINTTPLPDIQIHLHTFPVLFAFIDHPPELELN